VPTAAVPLPEPLAVKYAHAPTAAKAVTNSTAGIAIPFLVKSFFMFIAAFGRVMR
jgi:hypothetical protein